MLKPMNSRANNRYNDDRGFLLVLVLAIGYDLRPWICDVVVQRSTVVGYSTVICG